MWLPEKLNEELVYPDPGYFGTLSVNQKKIGDLLLESNHVTVEQLAQCLDIHAKKGRRQRLGEILVESGFIEFASLAQLLNQQAREAFFATLSWKTGMFYFYVDQKPANEEILLNERIDRLLLEGFVRMDNGAAAATAIKS